MIRTTKEIVAMPVQKEFSRVMFNHKVRLYGIFGEHLNYPTRLTEINFSVSLLSRRLENRNNEANNKKNVTTATCNGVKWFGHVLLLRHNHASGEHAFLNSFRYAALHEHSEYTPARKIIILSREQHLCF